VVLRVLLGCCFAFACSRAPTSMDVASDGPVEPSPASPETDGGESSEAPTPTDEPCSADTEAQPPPTPQPAPTPAVVDATSECPQAPKVDLSGDSDAGALPATTVEVTADASPPPLAASPSDAGLVDELEPLPSNGHSPMCVELLSEFEEATVAAALISEAYDCASHDECTEVDPCGGGAFCEIGKFLNVAAAEAFEATRETTCACYREVVELCPEPEAPSPVCFEGVCTGGFDGPEELVIPATCEERTASWERFDSILVANDGSYAGCGVIGVGNGCTGGECRYFAVSLPELDTLRAIVASHLRFNDCEECGPSLPCDNPPPVEDDNGNCRLVE
jgi:hypothetical protein